MPPARHGAVGPRAACPQLDGGPTEPGIHTYMRTYISTRACVRTYVRFSVRVLSFVLRCPTRQLMPVSTAHLGGDLLVGCSIRDAPGPPMFVSRPPEGMPLGRRFDPCMSNRISLFLRRGSRRPPRSSRSVLVMFHAGSVHRDTQAHPWVRQFSARKSPGSRGPPPTSRPPALGPQPQGGGEDPGAKICVYPPPLS